MNAKPTRADSINPSYTRVSLVAKDGAIVRVAASGYTKNQRKTWLRLEPISAPPFIITVANGALLNVLIEPQNTRAN